MFQGIIQAQEKILACSDSCLKIQVPVSWKLSAGDSLAVNGVCLTVTQISGARVSLDLGAETRKVTNLTMLKQGEIVNLERSLRYGERISGHLVLGHVDTVGKITKAQKSRGSLILEVALSRKYKKWLLPKGSIAIEGISLTINQIRGTKVQFCLIPETLRRTNLANKKKGAAVNIEFDYIFKMILSQDESGSNQVITTGANYG